MYKFLISLILILFNNIAFAEVSDKSFVSLSPALTETMYALGAENMLKGVSNSCTYPIDAKNKEKIGDSFFINEEKIIQINPNYILALDSSEFALNKFKKLNIIPICLKYKTIDDVHKNIFELGKLTNKEITAKQLVEKSINNIKSAKTKNPKRILYLVQTEPMITIGKKSFISDVIKNSGNTSITANIDSYYPIVTEEFLIRENPDIIVVSNFTDNSKIKKIFPNTKIIVMPNELNDIINRPGPRVYKSVEFFAEL